MRWLPILLIVAGCAQPKLQLAEGRLLVAPSALEVKGFVGFPIDRSISVTNTGRAVLSVGVSATKGLTVAERSLELASGQSVTVTVRIAAASSLVNGLLVANTNGGISGFPVGVKVSPTGWSVSERGNPERTARAR